MSSLRLRAGGMLRLGEFYVPRAADTEVLSWLRSGEIVAVLGARQTGKSSLRLRLAEALKRDAWVGAFELTTLVTAHDDRMFFHALAAESLKALRRGGGPGASALRQAEEEILREVEGEVPAQHWIRVLREIVARAEGRQVVLLFDEIDSSLRMPSQLLNDFWISVRAAAQDDAILPRLSFGLFGVFSPDGYLTDRDRTPFNNCRRAELGSLPRESFDLEVLRTICPDPETLLDAVLGWTDGHPYMTQVLLHDLAAREKLRQDAEVRRCVDESVQRRFLERGVSEDTALGAMHKFFLPYGQEHAQSRDAVIDAGALLRTDVEVLDALSDYARVRAAREITVGKISPSQHRVMLVGLVIAEQLADGQVRLRVRNRVVAEVFNDAWISQRRAGLTRPLREGVTAWIEGGRQAAYVFRGERLAKALAWAEMQGDALSKDERAFLDAGRDVERSELAADRRRRNLLIAVLGSAAVGFAIIFSVTLVQYRRANDAVRSTAVSRDEAEAARDQLVQERANGLSARVRTNTSVVDSQMGRVGSGIQVIQSILELLHFTDHEQTDHTREIRGFLMRYAVSQQVVRRQLPTYALRAHHGAIFYTSFSPDGTRVVTSGQDESANLWDVRGGRHLAAFRGHSSWVLSASFSSDGSRVVTASGDGTARIWDGHDGRLLASLGGHSGPVLSASFSSDGSLVVTGSTDRTARLWDGLSGRLIASLVAHQGPINSASFSPDGSHIVTASGDCTAMLWDGHSGRYIGSLEGHRSSVLSASFSPNGDRVVTASEDRTARVWDVHTRHLIARLEGHSAPVNSASFAPDGDRVVTASEDWTARVWNQDNGWERPLTLEGHWGAVVSASFSIDGTRLVTASKDRTARVWDGHSGELQSVLNKDFPFVRSASNGSGRDCSILGSGDISACTLDEQANRLRTSLTERLIFVASASFTRSGNDVVTALGDGTVDLWDVRIRQIRATLNGHRDAVVSASFKQDGSRIITASRDRTASLWDARTGQLVRSFGGHEGIVTSASFSPDGAFVVTTGSEGTAQIWDTHSQQRSIRLSGHLDRVNSASFSPDGTRIATASYDYTVRLWNSRSGECVATLRGHRDGVRAASFSLDGSRIVTASDDGTARLWDGHSGRLIATLEGHLGPVSSASFSSDGTRIVTASYDRTARLWNSRSGECLATLRGHRDGVSAASFSSDGKWIVTASDDRTANLWYLDLDPMRRSFCDAIQMIESVWRDPANDEMRSACR